MIFQAFGHAYSTPLGFEPPKDADAFRWWEFGQDLNNTQLTGNAVTHKHLFVKAVEGYIAKQHNRDELEWLYKEVENIDPLLDGRVLSNIERFIQTYIKGRTFCTQDPRVHINWTGQRSLRGILDILTDEAIIEIKCSKHNKHDDPSAWVQCSMYHCMMPPNIAIKEKRNNLPNNVMNALCSMHMNTCDNVYNPKKMVVFNPIRGLCFEHPIKTHGERNFEMLQKIRCLNGEDPLPDEFRLAWL